MQKVIVTIGAKQFSDRQLKSLQTVIYQNYQTHLSASRPKVIWYKIRLSRLKATGRNNYQTVVAIECDSEIKNFQKTQMIKDCIKDWKTITGQKDEDLVFKFESSLSLKQLVANKSGRKKGLLTLLQLLIISIEMPLSYFTKGYWSLRYSI